MDSTTSPHLLMNNAAKNVSDFHGLCCLKIHISNLRLKEMYTHKKRKKKKIYMVIKTATSKRFSVFASVSHNRKCLTCNRIEQAC